MADKQPNDSKPPSESDQSMVLYLQIGTGVLAVLLLVFGVWGILAGSEQVVAVGTAVRVGATLGVISLAMPQLAVLRRRLPNIAIAFVLVALFLISYKGNVGKILLGVMFAALAANTALAWLASITGKK